MVESLDKETDVEVLSDNGKSACISNREIYKILVYGHTPLELKNNFSNYKIIDEFELFVKSFINFIK